MPTSMQLTLAWARVPRFANLRLIYNRFTLSHIAIAYFVLALLHCISQIVLQIRGFKIEHSQSVHLHNIKNVGNVKDRFAILDSSDSILICHAIPGQTSDPHPCEKFNASGFSSTSLNASLDTCSEVLAWPAQIVHQAIRESIAMTVFQAWLFGISILAIITESIPHVVAGLVTQLLSTIWALYHIGSTERLHRSFNALVTNLACGMINPIPNYWESKQDNEIPIVALNGVSLLISVFLSWKLCKQFGAQSFTRVGGSKRIHHLYLLVLIFFVFLQLATFFLITSLVLWIEQLFDGPIASLANKPTVYLGAFIVTAVLIIPWRYLAWIAVRRERRHMMIVFLFTSIFLIMSQMGMFLNPIYRLTFSTWNFFGSVTVMAYVLLNITFAMALVCRYFFGRGLAHFLQVKKALDECDFTPVYIERGSGTFERAKETSGLTMPWDMEGNGVVKKLCLPLDKNHDGADLEPVNICTPPPSIFNSPTSHRSLRVSCSQATDSIDAPVILGAAVFDKKGASPTATDESGVLPDRLSHKSSVSSKSTRPEDGGDLNNPDEKTTHSIHRG